MLETILGVLFACGLLPVLLAVYIFIAFNDAFRK